MGDLHAHQQHQQQHAHGGDHDTDLSFEAITFGEEEDVGQTHAKRDPKLDKRKGPFKNDRLEPHSDSDKSSSYIYVSTKNEGEKMDVQLVLKLLEQFGIVKASYFKEKQNFGFIQFLDSSVVDSVVEAINNKGHLSDGVHILAEKVTGPPQFGNSLGANSLGTSFGTNFLMPFSPSTPSSMTTAAGGSLGVTSPTHQSTATSPTSQSAAAASAVSPSAPVVEKPDTILVLKNLPFSLKQDQLQEILMAMNSTAPQSINLHFDNMGVFRGMAFIKYRLLDDAIKVYEALNGYDVGGRKVRVEYKRKNKAQQADVPPEWVEEDDLKKLWEQVRDFSGNSTVNEISFTPNLSANQRKHIHAMAEKLKLTHYSSGDGDQRYICIRKMNTPSANSSTTSAPSSTPTTSTSSVPISQNGFGVPIPSGSADPRGAIDIKGRRPRRDSDNNRQVVGSPNSTGVGSHSSSATGQPVGSIEKEFRPRGNSASSDWRVQSPVHMMGQSPSVHVLAQSPSVPGMVTIAPTRQPKGPDGSKGFSDLYRNARKHTCIFQGLPVVDTSIGTEIPAIV